MRLVNVALTLSVTALLGSFVALGFGYKANGERVDDIQANRLGLLRANCLLANQQNGAIIRFVSHANASLEAQVRAAFPIRADCNTYARARLNLP